MDARERFLHPETLVSPRQINLTISPRTERAILWAIGLHPDDRPQTVEEFRQALLGDEMIITRPRVTTPIPKPLDYLKMEPEKYLVWGVLILTGISLLATLIP
jgi:serine/threonine-protein kinase